MKKLAQILLVAIIATVAFVQPIIDIAQANVAVSVHWVNDNSENCHKPGQSSIINNGKIEWIADIDNFGSEAVYIEKAAFHDPVSGCAATAHTLNQSSFSMSGKLNYAPGETGQTMFSYDINSYNCGRIQLDAAYRNVDGSYEGAVFMGEVFDYGVDCPGGVNPTTCTENAVVTATQIIPAKITAGSAIPFGLNIYNSGETWFYHGSFYQLVQTSNLTTSPLYGHLSPSMKPTDTQEKSFTLVAPSTPGVYTISFQMVHRAGAEYKDSSGIVCGVAPGNDIYFGNQVSMTFEVIDQAPSTNGNILVTSNIPTSWVVNGPQNFNGNGTYAMYSAQTGIYQLIFAPASVVYNGSNYLLKDIIPNQPQTLADQGTIAFQITYEKEQPSGAPVINSTNNATCNQITLTWDDTSSIEAGFHVYRSEQENGGDYTQYQRIATVSANTTSYVDHPQNNKSYHYIVAAYTNFPAQIYPSPAYKSSLVTACSAQIEGSMSVVAVNGQTGFKPENIKNGDTLRIQLLIDNLGPSAGYITKITDNPSINLSNVRNLAVSGPNAVLNSPAISGAYPNLTFNVSGKKDVGGNKWVIQFDTTLNSTSSTDTISNCSTIHYYDGTGSKTRRVCLTQLLTKTQNGAVKMREVAP